MKLGQSSITSDLGKISFSAYSRSIARLRSSRADAVFQRSVPQSRGRMACSFSAITAAGNQRRAADQIAPE